MSDPFISPSNTSTGSGSWPASWILPPPDAQVPFACVFRLKLKLDRGLRTRIHLSGDEQYEFFIDGEPLAQGPQPGCPDHWFYDSLPLNLSAGFHILTARLWVRGDENAPMARMSVAPGFLLAAEGKRASDLNTGEAPWQVRTLEGVGFDFNELTWGAGANLVIRDLPDTQRAAEGKGTGWVTARTGKPAWSGAHHHTYQLPRPRLFPATLPPVVQEPVAAGRVCTVETLAKKRKRESSPLRAGDPENQAQWQQLLDHGKSLTIPPHTRLRVLVDHQEYACAHPRIRLRKGQGSELHIDWAESLFTTPEGGEEKPHRDQWEGAYFIGSGDTWFPRGGRETFCPPFWHAGRYILLSIQTAEEPLTLNGFDLISSRYPLELKATLNGPTPEWEQTWDLMRRTLQVSIQETYVDSPYYERLTYIGDTRITSLLTYVLSGDDRPARAALLQFDRSRTVDGLVQARAPSRLPQIIPTFSLLWIGLVHDFALWRGDADFVRKLIPGMRATLHTFLNQPFPHGLLQPPNGWNFVDWVPDWDWGVPPGGADGSGALPHLHLLRALEEAADLEAWAGDPQLAGYWSRKADDLGKALFEACWDPHHRRLADTIQLDTASEHVQALALRTRAGTKAQRRDLLRALRTPEGLAPATVYFSHYVFEALYRNGAGTDIPARLSSWLDYAKRGLTTTPEQPEPTRSDCHGWGTHPLYHAFATLAGIRPASFGFQSVSFDPAAPGAFPICGSLPHPSGGTIDFDLAQTPGRLTLPRGVSQTSSIF